MDPATIAAISAAALAGFGALIPWLRRRARRTKWKWDDAAVKGAETVVEALGRDVPDEPRTDEPRK